MFVYVSAVVAYKLDWIEDLEEVDIYLQASSWSMSGSLLGKREEEEPSIYVG